MYMKTVAVGEAADRSSMHKGGVVADEDALDRLDVDERGVAKANDKPVHIRGLQRLRPNIRRADIFMGAFCRQRMGSDQLFGKVRTSDT